MSRPRARTRSVAIIGTRGYPSYYGGFETAVRRLAPYLSERGWQVTVYGRPGYTSEAEPSLDRSIITRTTWGIDRRSASTLTYGLSACIDATLRRPDVALVMNVANGYWLPILRSRGIPTYVNVDGMEWERGKWGRVGRRVFHTGAQLTARFGTRLVFDAHEIARRWRNEFGRDGDYIPYGGDIPGPLPLEPGLRHRGYVLAVARFVPENTIPQFLAAAEVLSDELDVVVVGSSGYGGELDERARALADANPQIRWLGHLSDDRRLFSLWQHAGAYFHGHSVGGTNPALVQAMACGAPTIARDTPYNREVLQDAGVFVQPHRDAIVAAARAVLRDGNRQEELSERAVRRFRDAFEWADVCAAYERGLRRLLQAEAS